MRKLAARIVVVGALALTAMVVMIGQGDGPAAAAGPYKLPWDAGGWNVTQGQHTTRAFDFQPPGAGSHNNEVLAVGSGTAKLVCSDSIGQSTVSLTVGSDVFRYLHLQTSSVSAAGITSGGVSVQQGQVLGRLYPTINWKGSCGTGTGSHLHLEMPYLPISIDGVTFSASGPKGVTRITSTNQRRTGSVPPDPARNPHGYVDNFSRPNSTTIHVDGWAVDPDVGGSISVHVVVDGEIKATVLANGQRPDLGGAFGFSTNVTVSSGGHTVRVVAINQGAGTGDVVLNPGDHTFASPYSWQFSSQAGYTDSTKSERIDLTKLVPGQTAWVEFRGVNTGTATWTQEGQVPVRLGTWNPTDRTSAFQSPGWLSAGRPAALSEATVAPGEIGTFEFPITAPSGASRAPVREYFNIVAEGQTWFNDLGLYLEMGTTVNPDQDNYWVWRGGSEAYSQYLQQAAQSFTAKLSRLDSVSFNVGNVSGGKIRVGITTDPAQSSFVPGSQQTVTASNFGETTVSFEPALDLTVGQRYFLRLTLPSGTSGDFVIYGSKTDDQPDEWAQFNGGNINQLDLNGRYRGHAGPVPSTAPTNLEAYYAHESVPDNAVELYWTAPEDTGGLPILGYRVSLSKDFNVSQPPITFSDDATNQTITGLEDGSVYFFWVSVITAAGVGPSSSGVPAIPSQRPSPPTNVVSTHGSSSVTVTWEEPVSIGATPIVRYHIRALGGTIEDIKTFDLDTDGSTRSVVIPGFNRNDLLTESRLQVTAVNAAGRVSDYEWAFPRSDTVPSPPTIREVTPLPHGARVWAESDYETSTFDVVAAYRVRVWRDGPGRGIPVQDRLFPIGNPNEILYEELTDLQPPGPYFVTVEAVNSFGNSEPAVADGSFVPLDDPDSSTTPGVPTSVQATGTSGGATVSWVAPSADGGKAITSYVVTPYSGGVAQTSVISPGTGTTAQVTGLTNGVTYSFKVAATNSIGTGLQSAASNSVTPATTPSPPTGVMAVAGNGQATVSWTSPASNGGSAVTSYKITPYVGVVAQPVINSSGSGTSKVVTGLTNGTAYTFKVAAVNAAGTGSLSAASASVTPVAPATAPGVPTGVTGTAGDGQVSLSWAAPASNGGSAITGYSITPYVGAVAQPVINSSGSGTSKVVTGLTNGTAYTFKVAAVNAVGTSSPSASSGVLTPSAQAAPFAPFASWSALIRQQYTDVTAKQPSSAQLSAWTTQLAAGTKTKGELVDSLRRGTENLSNVDPVVRVYRAFLGRAPDAGGLKFWIGRKRNVAPARTWTVTQIATGFTNSSEFKRKYGSLTNRQFVTQIYTDVLGRAADSSGINYWTGKLDRKEKTKAQVMVGFSESNEYRTKQAQNTDVTVAYVFLLGRAPASAESSDWVSRQKAGTSHSELIMELLDSEAYASRVAG